MDFRPVDTVGTITTRNLIRVNAFLNLLLVVCYLSIEPYVTGAHMSWIHRLHVLLQPLVLFVSITESTILTLGSLFLTATALVFDGVVVWLNYVAISRCYNTPSAPCFGLLWEKLVWFTIGALIVLSDLALMARLWTLNKSLAKKDVHEIANQEKHEAMAIKPAPVLSTMKVQNSKMRVIHLFLIPAGALYVYLIFDKLSSHFIYWVVVTHVGVDIYGVGTSKIHDRASLIILLAAISILICANVFNLIRNMSIAMETLEEELAFLISILFVFSDILILYYTQSNLSLLDKFDKIKNN